MNAFLFLATLFAPISSAAEIWPDADARIAAEYSNAITKKIPAAPGLEIECSFEITTKGNGVVQLPGLSVRVYDSHDDGLVYRDGLLRCEWRRDGPTLEFAVSGIAERSAGAADPLPIRGVFRYDAGKKRFEPVTCSREIFHWRTKGPNQALQPTRMLVTFRADARPAPSTRVADL